MKFGKYEAAPRLAFSGEAYEVFFANGYSASIVRGMHTYGGSAGLWEMAVMRDGCVCYDTSITSDVIGHLSETEVAGYLTEIENLPAPSPNLEET